MKREMVEGIIQELATMEQELKAKLYTVKTIQETLDIAAELEEVRAAREDAIIHKEHWIQTGFIYQ